jgi:tryptophan synthase beta chain
MYDLGLIEARAVHQNPVFEAAVAFAKAEGIVPAPESAHAVRVAIDEALAAKDAGEEKVIVFNLSGHGHFDMSAYDAYLAGKLLDYELPEEEVAKALANLPQIA